MPEESILGPLLFTIYTSDFINTVKDCKVCFYVADTQHYYSFPPHCINAACKVVNEDLHRLAVKFSNFCLSLIPSKSVVMLFGHTKSRTSVADRVYTKIGTSAVSRNLGVYLDSSL